MTPDHVAFAHFNIPNSLIAPLWEKIIQVFSHPFPPWATSFHSATILKASNHIPIAHIENFSNKDSFFPVTQHLNTLLAIFLPPVIQDTTTETPAKKFKWKNMFYQQIPSSLKLKFQLTILHQLLSSHQLSI